MRKALPPHWQLLLGFAFTSKLLGKRPREPLLLKQTNKQTTTNYTDLFSLCTCRHARITVAGGFSHPGLRVRIRASDLARSSFLLSHLSILEPPFLKGLLVNTQLAPRNNRVEGPPVSARKTPREDGREHSPHSCVALPSLP